MECRIQHKNGSWQWHTQSGSLIRDAGGNVVSFVGISHDISERRRAEDAIRLANRQLSLLNSITRHDILNKITIILGYLDLAESTSPNPDLAGYLENMESATRAIHSQIEFTRVYQDLGTHEAQWIDLDTIITHLQVPAAITLESGVQGVFVFADPMLEKVFFNLLDNSIRHGQRVTRIRVSAHQSGRDLVVVWEDNGAGIAADEKERIFERGFGKNTGLGMFLVRDILSITGITILETGEQGKGVRFEMTVPRGMFR
jgi:signal transduction histidine kinase